MPWLAGSFGILNLANIASDITATRYLRKSAVQCVRKALAVLWYDRCSLRFFSNGDLVMVLGLKALFAVLRCLFMISFKIDLHSSVVCLARLWRFLSLIVCSTETA